MNFKITRFLLISLLAIIPCFLSGCNEKQTLSIMFAPSKNKEEILTKANEIKPLLTTYLKQHGYDFHNIDVSVGDSYEMVGEALSAGSVDIAFIPAGTYIQYQDKGIIGLLTALHEGVNINSLNPQDWNDNKPTKITDDACDSYQGLIISENKTDIGKAITNKVKQQQLPSFEELNQATWCVGSPTSSSGYIYPSYYLKTHYGKTIEDLEHKIQSTGYNDSINSLTSGVCNIATGYADFRLDYQDNKPNIFLNTDVIGVTDNIVYDTISVSKTNKMNQQLQDDLKNFFINLKNNPQAKNFMQMFHHVGYEVLDPQKYLQEAQIMKEVLV